MTVSITPRGQLQRRDLYSGVSRVWSNGAILWLSFTNDPHSGLPLPLQAVAEIALDEESGAFD